MPGPNTTGKPNTADYNLGRGILYFATLDPTTQLPEEYRDLGNAPEFNISLEVETLDHQSSRGGLKVTDKQVTISQKVNVSLTLDEINFENLANFLAGSANGTSDTDTAGHLNPSFAGIANREIVATNQIVKGRWYELRDASGNRAYDIDKTLLTVQNGNATPVVYSNVTDYEVDQEMGMIFILSTGAVATTGVDSSLEITLTPDVSADNYIPEVKALTSTAITGAMKFIGQNPADGDSKMEYQFHQISLKADGDFGLISDEFTQMTLTGVAESNALADADSPTLTIRTVATPQT